jgi:DNA-binding LacI/PurR family transcriptional regulator
VLQDTDSTVARQVSDHLRGFIARERLKRGDALPSYRQLASQLGAALWTVKRGIDELAKDGVVYRQRGRGVYVAKELVRRPRPPHRLAVIVPSTRHALFNMEYLLAIMRGITLKPDICPLLQLFSLQQDGLINAATLGEQEIDGVILLNVEDEAYIRSFVQWGTPTVATDYVARGVPLDFVACDNRAAARRVAAHLAGLGHRRVRYVTESVHSESVNLQGQRVIRDSSDIRERQRETLAALRAAGVACDAPPEAHSDASGSPAAVSEDIHAHLHDPGRATAVIVNDCYAAGKLTRELTQRGVRVPEDVSLAALSSDGGGWRQEPELTCCKFDFVGMGRRAIELLAQRCRKPVTGKTRVHRIGFAFVEGKTAGRPRER